MRIDEDFLLKIAQIVSGFATPIAVSILGVFLVRRIEGIKAESTKQSAFHVKWADEFFDICQEFMRVLERELVILIYISAKDDKSDDLGTKMQQEQGKLHLSAYELQLRIKRLSVFSPKYGPETSRLSENCFNLVNRMISERQAKLDPIFQNMNEFNRSARFSHAEMLALEDTKRV